MMYEPPDLDEAYKTATVARARGQRFIRVLVPPNQRRFAQFFVEVWPRVTGRTKDRVIAEETLPDGTKRWIVEALVVEVSTTSVIEAFGREQIRRIDEEKYGSQRMRVNQTRTRSRFTMNR